MVGNLSLRKIITMKMERFKMSQNFSALEIIIQLILDGRYKNSRLTAEAFLKKYPEVASVLEASQKSP